MAITTTSLSNKIEQINHYLANKIEQEPSYQDFIQELKATLIHYRQTKLKIKFVSQRLLRRKKTEQSLSVGQFVNLAEQLKQISQQQFTEQLLCQFHTVADVTKIDSIVEDCDLLCIVRDSHTKVSKLDKQLIRKANKANICQTILNMQRVENNNSQIFQTNSTSINTWLNKQEYDHVQSFFLPLYPGKNCDLSEQTNDYYYFIENLLSIYESQLEARISRTITLKFSRLFANHRKSILHQIKQRKLDLNSKQQTYHQQKYYLFFQKNKHQRQSQIKKIKEKIYQEKIAITNSFSYDSLLYKVSQLVDRSEANLFKENQKQYIQLIIKEQDFSQRLNTVVINLCYQELAKWIADKWQEINQISEPISSNNHYDLDHSELEPIQKLSLTPNFELTKFISLPLLEETSRTIFNYRLLDSSRFRLAVAIAFGLVLYFFTGRLFGFAFLIFQLINFLTGKDIRTKRLKQQTKELKRKSANQYQSLVRFLSDRAFYTLISALENRNQSYQELIHRLTEESEEQLNQLKQTISEHKEKLNNLKRDELEILSLLQQN